KPQSKPEAMSTYRLDRLFEPRSVAVVGASPRENSLGRAIIRNVREAGFGGAFHLINPRYAEIDGITAIKRLDALPSPVDVDVIAGPPARVPQTVAAAAHNGAAAAIIITAGLGHGPGSFAEAAAQAAHSHGLRLIGPNCLGVMVPSAKLNASFATRMALP